jgi:hypothetical protein
VSSALVVGSPGCGMTTFFGLLYTAEVRLGGAESDAFRVHFDHDSIRRLAAIYTDLGDGRFPASEVDWSETPLAFLLGIRASPLLHRPPSVSPAPEEFDPRRVEVGGLSTEEAAELAERDTRLDDTSRRLLRSPVVIALLDASSFPTDSASDIASLARDDRRLARTLELSIGFLSAERRRAERRLHPVFVLTKCDRLSPAARTFLGLGASAPLPRDPRERTALGAKILARLFPKTERALASAGARRVSVAPASWYFSEVGTGPIDHERIRRRWRTPEGGWEPDYPWDEYRALLGRIGELAQRRPARAGQ